MEGVSCILLDIEGTVCPISFVKDTLFPYALRALPHVLATQWTSPALAPYLAAFSADARASPAALQAHVEALTRADAKVAALKDLQGYLWADGYASGAYATPLFGDVVPALRSWSAAGLRLAIYSSGSVYAQKLLFGHVGPAAAGHVSELSATGQQAAEPTEDLKHLFEDWFDTTNAGPKTEPGSYSTIAEQLKCEPSEILFLSDNVKEVDAAILAGMQSVVVDRPGNAPLAHGTAERLQVVETLRAISVKPFRNNEA